MEQDIDKCVELVLGGDIDAYEEIVRQTQHRLRAYILHYCPRIDAVEDVAQDTYLYAYEHLSEYSIGTDFFAWLRSLAQHRALLRIRTMAATARREQRYADAVLLERASEVSEDPGELDRIEALKQCMQNLPDTARKLLTSRYEAGRSAEEVALILGRSASSVRVSLFRIRERLRQCVERRSAREGGV